MQNKLTHQAYNLTEILVSLLVLGVLVALSFQLFQPNRSDAALSRKVDTYVNHLSNIHSRIVSQYGVTPLNVDLNGDGCAVDDRTNGLNGIPNFINNFDSTAAAGTVNVGGANVDYLQYPNNLRVYIRPEQFSWMTAHINAFTPLGYERREFMLIDVDPGTVPTGLADSSTQTNTDVVLIHVEDQTGTITTSFELASKHGITSLNSNNRRTFYDLHKA
jgi:hypothetical protein